MHFETILNNFKLPMESYIYKTTPKNQLKGKKILDRLLGGNASLSLALTFKISVQHPQLHSIATEAHLFKYVTFGNMSFNFCHSMGIALCGCIMTVWVGGQQGFLLYLPLSHPSEKALRGKVIHIRASHLCI